MKKSLALIPGLFTFMCLSLSAAAHAQDSEQTSVNAEPMAASFALHDSDRDDNTLSDEEINEAMKKLGQGTNALGDGMAQGIASVIARFGHPLGVIIGREAQGSLILGYRKGSGKVVYKGDTPQTARKIFWSAPSIGIGAGLTSSRVCILIYGAHNYDQLLGSYGSGQGSAHWLAGASVSVISNLVDDDSKNITLANVAVGIGFDLTARVEGMKLSKSEGWLPF
jgi:hypothetical protein